MTQTLEAKLARIKHYATRYELAVIKDDRKVLVLYTARRNRQGMLSACRQVGEALVKFAGAENIQFGKRAADGATLGAWAIRFTGRTQREAYMAGELPWVGGKDGGARV